MSDASDKLAKSRRAILEHVARRHRKHDPHEENETRYDDMGGYAEDQDPPDPGEGWFGHMKHAVRTWWRYHPAHMAVELASPMMQGYARRNPGKLLAISLGAGAALTLARPWKLISLTTLVVALLKSSQLSSLLIAAASASTYRKDAQRPEWK